MCLYITFPPTWSCIYATTRTHARAHARTSEHTHRRWCIHNCFYYTFVLHFFPICHSLSTSKLWLVSVLCLCIVKPVCLYCLSVSLIVCVCAVHFVPESMHFVTSVRLFVCRHRNDMSWIWADARQLHCQKKSHTKWCNAYCIRK